MVASRISIFYPKKVLHARATVIHNTNLPPTAQRCSNLTYTYACILYAACQHPTVTDVYAIRERNLLMYFFYLNERYFGNTSRTRPDSPYEKIPAHIPTEL